MADNVVGPRDIDADRIVLDVARAVGTEVVELTSNVETLDADLPPGPEAIRIGFATEGVAADLLGLCTDILTGQIAAALQGLP